MGGTDTGTTVTSGLVGEGVLAEVVADHLSLDFDGVEGLAVVDTDHGADHGGGDDGVAAVGSDGGGLLAIDALALGLENLAEEDLVLDLLATGAAATGTGGEEGVDLLLGHLKKSLEGDTAVGELTEGTLDWCSRGVRHLYIL